MTYPPQLLPISGPEEAWVVDTTGPPRQPAQPTLAPGLGWKRGGEAGGHFHDLPPPTSSYFGPVGEELGPLWISLRRGHYWTPQDPETASPAHASTGFRMEEGGQALETLYLWAPQLLPISGVAGEDPGPF